VKIWYLSQVLPPPTRQIQQLTSTCTWFIWKGGTFRVPTTTLQRPKDQGGWALPDIALKGRAFLLGRMWTFAAQKVSATAAFLRTWNLTDAAGNPPHVGKIPSKLVHVRQYALDMAYVSPSCTNEPLRKLRSRIYGVLRAIRGNTETSDVMRVVHKYSDASWKRLWTNLHTAGISDTQRSTWYNVIHDLTPINDRLAAINLSENNRCSTCGAVDTTQHRLTQCGMSQLIWNWTRARTADITSTNTLYVP